MHTTPVKLPVDTRDGTGEQGVGGRAENSVMNSRRILTRNLVQSDARD